MTEDDPRTAPDRLDAALSALEVAVARVAAAEQSRADLVDTLAVMDEDRQRLADDLDAALARANAVQSASEVVGQRLESLGRRVSALIGDAGEP